MSNIQFEYHDVDGKRLHVASRLLEKKDVTPLLIFNGIGAGLELLEPLLESLNIPTITFDLPGLGGSPASNSPTRMHQFALMAKRLLEQLNIDKVHVMGISWGGGLAQQFAYQFPNYSDRLILAATSTGHLMVPPKPSVLLRMATPLRYFSSNHFKKIAGDIYGGDFRRDQKRIESHTKRMGPPALRGYLGQLYAMAGWTSVFYLHKITQKTLVMAGEDDPIIPLVNARFMNRQIPDSTLDIYDCGHLFILTRLERAVASIESFVKAEA